MYRPLLRDMFGAAESPGNRHRALVDTSQQAEEPMSKSVSPSKLQSALWESTTTFDRDGHCGASLACPSYGAVTETVPGMLGDFFGGL